MSRPLARFSSVVVALTGALLGGCADRAQPTAPTRSAAPRLAAGAAGGAFTPSACRFQLPAGQTEGQSVQCGYVTVPEQRAQSGGRTIRVSVAVFKALNGAPAPDPLFILTGGPGLSGQTVVSVLSGPVAQLLQGTRDVVVVDQRGVDTSDPSLDCPEITAQNTTSLPQAEAVAVRVRNAARCRARLTAAGVDLGAYSSGAIAADVNDVRQALGYATINLLGFSYGTRPALEVIRDYPATLRAVVVDGVAAPQRNLLAGPYANQERTLGLVFAACAADAQCAAQNPKLDAALEEVFNRLNAQPATVTVTNPDTGGPLTLTLDGYDVISVIQTLLANRATYVQIPALVTEARAGVYTRLGANLQPAPQAQAQAGARLFAEGVYYSVICSEDAKSPTLPGALAAWSTLRPSLRAYAQLVGGGDLTICGSWTSANNARSAPVVGSVPTLLLNGEFDPATAPEWGRAAASTLSRSTYVEVPYSGHVQLQNEPLCALTLIAGYLAAPGGTLNTACVAGVQPPLFAAPNVSSVATAPRG